MQLDNAALATSGDYQNFVQINGKTYSHTIDPKTGWPIQHDLASSSIVADDCMTADAIATAVMVMGPEAAKLFCSRHGYEYYLILRNTDGQLIDVASQGFPWYQEKPQEKPDRQQFWQTFVTTLAVFLLVVVAMAVGVIFGRRRITGSCGGIASLESGAVSPECSTCRNPSQQCQELKKALEQRKLDSAG